MSLNEVRKWEDLVTSEPLGFASAAVLLSNGKDVCLKMVPSAFQNIMNDLVGMRREVESSEKKQRFKPNGEIYYE